jgi:DNA-binding PadR family transcriptional regulator
MSLDDRAELLETVVQSPLGVRELVRKLRWSSSRVIRLLGRMREEGLIELEPVKSVLRGRPKKTVILTPLGLDFLETHRVLRMKPLRARREDFDRAVRDALYAERLVARGHSSFKLFLELNEIVRNIRSSSEASEPT